MSTNKCDIKEIQVSLFDRIRQLIPENKSLVGEISGLLGLNADSAYRRIRGASRLTMEEIVTLCNSFDLSFDELIRGQDNRIYNFIPLNINNIDDYILYSSFFEEIKKMPECEITLTAADIPFFHFYPHIELTFFQIFSLHKNSYDFKGSYEDFVKNFDFKRIKEISNKSSVIYQQIPSTEIWTNQTIDPTLKILLYHAGMNHFEDTKTPLLIMKQLLDIICLLEKCSEKGEKGSEHTHFDLLVSELDIGNTFVYIKNNKESNCYIRLFTINGLNIRDRKFCEETELWLTGLIRRSTLISRKSSVERVKFFNAQKQKITDAISSL